MFDATDYYGVRAEENLVLVKGTSKNGTWMTTIVTEGQGQAPIVRQVYDIAGNTVTLSPSGVRCIAGMATDSSNTMIGVITATQQTVFHADANNNYSPIRDPLVHSLFSRSLANATYWYGKTMVASNPVFTPLVYLSWQWPRVMVMEPQKFDDYISSVDFAIRSSDKKSTTVAISSPPGIPSEQIPVIMGVSLVRNVDQKVYVNSPASQFPTTRILAMLSFQITNAGNVSYIQVQCGGVVVFTDIDIVAHTNGMAYKNQIQIDPSLMKSNSFTLVYATQAKIRSTPIPDTTTILMPSSFDPQLVATTPSLQLLDNIFMVTSNYTVSAYTKVSFTVDRFTTLVYPFGFHSGSIHGGSILFETALPVGPPRKLSPKMGFFDDIEEPSGIIVSNYPVTTVMDMTGPVIKQVNIDYVAKTITLNVVDETAVYQCNISTNEPTPMFFVIGLESAFNLSTVKDVTLRASFATFLDPVICVTELSITCHDTYMYKNTVISKQGAVPLVECPEYSGPTPFYIRTRSFVESSAAERTGSDYYFEILAYSKINRSRISVSSVGRNIPTREMIKVGLNLWSVSGIVSSPGSDYFSLEFTADGYPTVYSVNRNQIMILLGRVNSGTSGLYDSIATSVPKFRNAWFTPLALNVGTPTYNIAGTVINAEQTMITIPVSTIVGTNVMRVELTVMTSADPYPVVLTYLPPTPSASINASFDISAFKSRTTTCGSTKLQYYISRMCNNIDCASHYYDEVPAIQNSVQLLAETSLPVINEVFLSNMTIKQTVSANSTDISMSKIIDNTTYVIDIKLATDNTPITWMGENMNLPKGSIKYTLNITNYNFADQLNQLMITWNISATSTTSCSESPNTMTYDGQDGGSSEDFRFFEWTFSSYKLYARFPKSGLIDGRPTRLVNRELESSDPSEHLLGTIVPRFIQNALIDPGIKLTKLYFSPYTITVSPFFLNCTTNKPILGGSIPLSLKFKVPSGGADLEWQSQQCFVSDNTSPLVCTIDISNSIYSSTLLTGNNTIVLDSVSGNITMDNAAIVAASLNTALNIFVIDHDPPLISDMVVLNGVHGPSAYTFYAPSTSTECIIKVQVKSIDPISGFYVGQPGDVFIIDGIPQNGTFLVTQKINKPATVQELTFSDLFMNLVSVPLSLPIECSADPPPQAQYGKLTNLDEYIYQADSASPIKDPIIHSVFTLEQKDSQFLYKSVRTDTGNYVSIIYLTWSWPRVIILSSHVFNTFNSVSEWQGSLGEQLPSESLPSSIPAPVDTDPNISGLQLNRPNSNIVYTTLPLSQLHTTSFLADLTFTMTSSEDISYIQVYVIHPTIGNLIIFTDIDITLHTTCAISCVYKRQISVDAAILPTSPLEFKMYYATFATTYPPLAVVSNIESPTLLTVGTSSSVASIVNDTYHIVSTYTTGDPLTNVSLSTIGIYGSLTYPFGFLHGDATSGTLLLETTLPTTPAHAMIETPQVAGIQTQTNQVIFDLHPDTTFIDIFPPAISFVSIDYVQKTISIQAIDYTGLESGLDMRDPKNVTLVSSFATFLDPVTCVSEISMGCVDLYGNTAVLLVSGQGPIPFVQCPSYSGPIPFYLRTKSALNNGATKFEILTYATPDITSLTVVPFPGYGSPKAMTRIGNVWRLDDTFVATTIIEFSPLFIANGKTYSINNLQLTILLHRVNSGGTERPNLSQAFYIPRNVDTVPPVVKSAIASNLNGVVTITVEVEDSDSMVASITLTYYTNLDPKPLKQTINTNAPVIKIDPTAPTCLFQANETIDPTTSNQQMTSYQVMFHSIREVSATNSNQIINEVFLSNMTIKQAVSAESTDLSMSKIIDNTTYVIDIKLATEFTSSMWFGEKINLQKGSIKYTLNITNYNFANQLNQLMITWNISATSTTTTSCSESPNTMIYNGQDGVSPKDDFRFFEWTFSSFKLYARFPKSGLIDGRPDILVNKELVSSDPSKHLLATVLPHFQRNALVDPDFSMLFHPYKDICDSDTVEKWIVIVAVVVPTVIVIIGSVILAQDIKLIHANVDKIASVPTASADLLRLPPQDKPRPKEDAICGNNGCGKEYSEETLNQCCFHPGTAIFHEGLKGWSCCTKRVLEFEEFLLISGCAAGEHKERVKPDPKAPRQAAAASADPSLPTPVPVQVTAEGKQVFSSADTTKFMPKPVKTTEKKAIITPKEYVEINDEPNAVIQPGAPCCRATCKATYIDESSRNEPCTYHSGEPVFHEGSKVDVHLVFTNGKYYKKSFKLANTVSIEKSRFDFMSTKVEIKLVKDPQDSWSKLEESEADLYRYQV
eukprot:gene17965-21438_t